MYIICIYTYRERERLILNHFEPFPLRKNVEVFTRGLNWDLGHDQAKTAKGLHADSQWPRMFFLSATGMTWWLRPRDPRDLWCSHFMAIYGKWLKWCSKPSKPWMSWGILFWTSPGTPRCASQGCNLLCLVRITEAKAQNSQLEYHEELSRKPCGSFQSESLGKSWKMSEVQKWPKI